MTITDHSSYRNLQSITVCLTPDEARELVDHLSRLLGQPGVGAGYVAEFADNDIARELTVMVDRRRAPRLP